MPYPYKSSYCVILWLSIQLIGCSTRKSLPAGLKDVKACDTTEIVLDKQIAREFPRVDSLLRHWVADKHGVFQLRQFRDFFASEKTRLYFTLGEFHSDTAASSYGAKMERGLFKDTISLNKTLFNKVSQEFLASVVIHEDLHAFITWCCLSYAAQRNGVDAKFLKKNFHSDWLLLTRQPFLSNKEEHVLMTKDFIWVMFRSLYRCTNPRSSPILREAVTRSLTWGGLVGTPEWGMLTVDTCYLRSVDIWARNMDADSTKGVYWGQCEATGVRFLHSLELQPLAK